MTMNRTIEIVGILSLSALSWSAWGQGVGLWAPGAVLGPVVSHSAGPSAIRSYSGSRVDVGSRSADTAPRTVLTSTGRYLVTHDPATGYVTSIIEVSRTRE